MYQAPNMFPDDPDAQQAFVDALPIVAELLNASARVPANSQAGRGLRMIEQQSAVEHQVHDLTEQVAFKADRAGVPLDDFIALCERTVKRRARGTGAETSGKSKRPLGPNRDARGRELHDAVVAAETAMAAATRAVTAGRVELQTRLRAQAEAKKTSEQAWAALRAYERTLAA